jgi:hypothetical protein
MFVHPGKPPVFWVTSSGILHERAREPSQTILPNLPPVQAGTVPPLLHLRLLHAGNGPSLSLARLLHRIL